MRSATSAITAAFILMLALMLATIAAPLQASEPSLDSTAAALSAYLHNNRLPLVEARLVSDALGFHTLVLYGFVATAFGKSDAEAQSRRFLKETDIVIDNRIMVRPELLHPQTTSPGTAVATGAPVAAPVFSGPTDDETAPSADAEAGQALGDVDAYEDQEENDLQIGAPFVPPIPLVALGVIPLMPFAQPTWGYSPAPYAPPTWGYSPTPYGPSAPGYSPTPYAPPAWGYPPNPYAPPAWGYRANPYAPPPVYYGYHTRPYAPAPWMATGSYTTTPITGPLGTTTVFAPPVTPGRIMPLPGALPSNYIAPPASYAPMGGMQYFHNSFGGGGFGFGGGFHR